VLLQFTIIHTHNTIKTTPSEGFNFVARGRFKFTFFRVIAGVIKIPKLKEDFKFVF
jgi:hypothetical protein